MESVEVEEYKRLEKTLTYLIKYCFSLGLDNPQSELSYLQKTKENQLPTHSPKFPPETGQDNDWS